MALTLWIDSSSGERLDYTRLRDLRCRARALCAVNVHIFEDEHDALAALDVVPFLLPTSDGELSRAVEISHDDRSAAPGDEATAAQ
jgi:hypothetical protein